MSSTVRAEDKATAQREYQAASQHYDLGEWSEALEGFKRAYRAYPEPSFLYNIGQCERQLGNKEKAIASYKMYLIKVPDAPNAQQVRDVIHKLEQAVEEERATKANQPAAPAPALAPAVPVAQPAPAAAITAQPAPPRERTPVYKKWWFWTAVGVVAVGAAVGVGVGVTEARGTPSVTTSLGNVGPF